jgi:signal transduction histidine kinase
MLRSLLARATTVIIPIEDEIAALRRVVRLAGASHSRAWREALVVAPDAVDAYVPPLILSTVFDALVSDRDYARTITGWHLHVRRDHAFLALRMQLDSDRDPRLRVPVLSAVLAPRIRGLAGPSATTTVEATSEGLVVTVAVPYADENTDATTVDEIATHTVSATFPVRNLGVTIRYWVFRVAFIALFAVFQRITTTDSVASLVRTMAIFLWCMIGAAIWPLDRKAWQSEGEHRTAWSRYRMWVLVAIAGLAARRIALFDAAPSSAALAIAILESVFAAGIVAVICVAIAMAFNFLEERAHLAVAEQRIAADVDLASQRRAEIELAALKAELNPHWVSNALNAVAGLIERAPDRAERMCDALAALLAEATARVGVQEVSLAEELAGLQPFLTIERERRPDGALTFTLDVPDNVRHARVPSMLLQPAIENAVKHGLMPRGGAGTISVHATRLGDRLQLDVLDDGVGIPTQSATPSARAAGTGIGTHHTLARLDELYGSQATMSIVNRTDGPGAMTRFSLPWHATAA